MKKKKEKFPSHKSNSATRQLYILPTPLTSVRSGHHRDKNISTRRCGGSFMRCILGLGDAGSEDPPSPPPPTPLGQSLLPPSPHTSKPNQIRRFLDKSTLLSYTNDLLIPFKNFYICSSIEEKKKLRTVMATYLQTWAWGSLLGPWPIRRGTVCLASPHWSDGQLAPEASPLRAAHWSARRSLPAEM